MKLDGPLLPSAAGTRLHAIVSVGELLLVPGQASPKELRADGLRPGVQSILQHAFPVCLGRETVNTIQMMFEVPRIIGKTVRRGTEIAR